MKRLVFVDVDDTLLSPPYAAVKRASELLGKRFPTELQVRQRTHIDFFRAFPKLFRNKAEMWGVALLSIPFGYFRSQEPLEFDVAAMSRCLADDRVYLLTKNPPIFARSRIARLREIFGNSIGERYLACGPMFSRGKRKIDIMRAVAEARGLDISACLLVDDSIENIEQARNGGAQTLLVNTAWNQAAPVEGVERVCVTDLPARIQDALGQAVPAKPMRALLIPAVTPRNAVALTLARLKLRWSRRAGLQPSIAIIPLSRNAWSALFHFDPQAAIRESIGARLAQGVCAAEFRVLSMKGATPLLPVSPLADPSVDAEARVRAIRRAAYETLLRAGDEVPAPRLYYFTGHSRAEEVSRILTSSPVAAAVLDHATANALSEEEARRLAERYAREIVTPRSYMGCVFCAGLFRIISRRIFRRIDASRVTPVVAPDLDRFLIYASIHRSYLDSGILFTELAGIAQSYPYIVAAKKMRAVWLGKMGTITGSIFVETKFVDALYVAVMGEHIRRIQIPGNCLEVFLEGQRSRSGLTLPPKKGVASAVWANMPPGSDSAAFVPVSFAYNKLPESEMLLPDILEERKRAGQASLREITDLEIKRQVRRSRGQIRSFRALVRKLASPPVSECFLRIGEPIGMTRATSATDASGDAELKHCLTRTMHAVNEITHVLPSSVLSLAASGSEDGHLQRKDAEAFLELSRELLGVYQAIPSNPQFYSATVSSQVSDFIKLPFVNRKFKRHRLHNDELITITDLDIERSSYYRNNVLHFFVLPALLSAVLLETPSGRTEELHRFLSHMFEELTSKYFLPRIGHPGDYIAEVLACLERRGLLSLQGQFFTVNSEASNYPAMAILTQIGSQLADGELSQVFQKFRRTFQRVDVSADTTLLRLLRPQAGSGKIQSLSDVGCFIRSECEVQLGDHVTWTATQDPTQRWEGRVVRKQGYGFAMSFDSALVKGFPAPGQRGAPRKDVDLPGSLAVSRPLGIQASLQNISTTGAFIATPLELCLEDRLLVHISALDLSIEVGCKVARVAEDGLGIHFNLADSETKAELALFIQRLLKRSFQGQPAVSVDETGFIGETA